ncbi:hypothetical protein EWB00_005433 [Schistosoma japonicum]|uniref:Uncharacterized protein n=1 Tax=Schistosoma japonicum TaxID=6182 RepID=A0A4Z2DU40_SCHJA|nr:hypothetical protein EWB00_005433 [Schistosoma japonicum]
MNKDMRLKLLIGCNVPKTYKVIEKRFWSVTGRYATRTLLVCPIRGPFYLIQRRCTKLKANHEIVMIIGDIYSKEFKEYSQLGPGWSVYNVTAVRLVEQSCEYKDGLERSSKFKRKVLACNKDLTLKRLRKLVVRLETS